MAQYASTSSLATTITECDYDPASDEIWWPILSGEEAARMVPYPLAPDEKIIMCPYDHSHWIRLSKTSNHLFRCRKNYFQACTAEGIEPKKVECRFNSTHMLDEPERMYHEFQCSYREKSEEEQLKDVTRYAPKLFQDAHSVIKPEEEWYVDPRVQSYDPRDKLRGDAFLIPHCNSVMNKTEKKTFQAQQRWHFYTRASSSMWKDLGAEEPQILQQPIILPEGNDGSVSEILAELRLDEVDVEPNVAPEEPPLHELPCIQFVNNFFTGPKESGKKDDQV